MYFVDWLFYHPGLWQFSALKSPLCDIIIAFFWLFAWYIFPILLLSIPAYIIIYFKWGSWRYSWVIFLNTLANLCLLIIVFRLFTFNIIIDMLGLQSTILFFFCYIFCFFICFFLSSCEWLHFFNFRISLWWCSLMYLLIVFWQLLWVLHYICIAIPVYPCHILRN